MDGLVEDLKQINTFAALSLKDREAVAGICKPVHFVAGEVIAMEGGNAEKLYAFFGGSVGIWVDHGTGWADLLAITEAPCLAGEMSVVDELPRSATIVARQGVSGYSMCAKAFRQLLRERGSIALALMKGISRIVRSSNDSFIDELREKNKKLTKTNHELRDAQQQLVRQERLSSLGKFSSMIIHDLRNPLSVIRGYADMLELKLGGGNFPESGDLKRYAAQIRRETIRLTSLANEWLDYSRGEIRLAYSPTKLTELFFQLQEDTEAALSAKQILVRWENYFDGTVLLDVDRILRTLINLIDNARKACSRGGRITIKAAKENNHLLLVVKDDGIGMDSETQSHIFDPFFSKSESGGTGLGLHIVRTVIDAHNGTIAINSAPSSGTEVIIRLPLRF